MGEAISGTLILSAECGAESLVTAFRQVLRVGRRDGDADELTAMLGLGLAMTASAGEARASQWTGLGRNLQLDPVCDRLGLRLRGLHPDWAARGLGTSLEFDAHFRDSYAPLIRRALEHGQTVLAWRGWQGEARPEWGLIEATEGDAFRGRCGSAGEDRRLTGPAHLVYVVEALEPRAESASASERWQLAIRSVRRYWAGEPAPDGVLLGRAAYARWIALAGVPSQWQEVSSALAVIAASRRAFARWLAAIGPQLGRPDAEACRAASVLLADWSREAQSGEGRLVGVLERLWRIDEAAVARLAP